MANFLGFEDHGLLGKNYPGLLDDCVPMVNLMVRVNAKSDANDFERAVRSLLLYCWELSVSIVKLIESVACRQRDSCWLVASGSA